MKPSLCKSIFGNPSRTLGKVKLYGKLREGCVPINLHFQKSALESSKMANAVDQWRTQNPPFWETFPKFRAHSFSNRCQTARKKTTKIGRRLRLNMADIWPRTTFSDPGPHFRETGPKTKNPKRAFVATLGASPVGWAWFFFGYRLSHFRAAN